MMILCFSGTGNSRHIATRLSEGLMMPLLDMNGGIRQHIYGPFDTGEDVVVVVPTYAWRIPRIVDEWLCQAQLEGAKRIWFVMSCGGQIANAGMYNERLAHDLHLEYMGTAQIVMPENYIAMFDAPQADEARAIVKAAEPEIDTVIQLLQKGMAFPAIEVDRRGKVLSGAINAMFYPKYVKATPFTVGDGCTGCGTCEAKCPMNNIVVVDGRPKWGKDCTHCMACICYCPAEAIEYGEASKGRPRYHFEALGIDE